MSLQILEFDGWKANLKFSAAHVIPDFTICGRLHGHTYAIHAKFYGEPTENGIIMDFGLIKKALRGIAEVLDHRVLVPKKNSAVKISKNSVAITIGSKHYVFPQEDCVFLPLATTSAENLAAYVLDSVRKEMSISKNIVKIEIGIDEGPGQGAWATWEKK